MNTFSNNSFRQKMLKCTVMIIILLQTACAANFAKLGGGLKESVVPKSSKLTSNGAGHTLTCGVNASRKASAKPNAQPTPDVYSPQNPQPDSEEEVEKKLRKIEEALQVIEQWKALPASAKKVIAGTTLAGAAIGGAVAYQRAKDDESDDSDSKEVIHGVVLGAVEGAEVGSDIITVGSQVALMAGLIVFVVAH